MATNSSHSSTGAGGILVLVAIIATIALVYFYMGLSDGWKEDPTIELEGNRIPEVSAPGDVPNPSIQ